MAGAGLLVTTALLGIGCTPIASRTRDQPATVVTESDPGVPLPNVAVLIGEKEVARTDERGRASLLVRGLDGESFPIAVRCPEGHRPTRSADFAVIVRKSDDGRAPEFHARCARTQRHAVVVLKAGIGKDLPVLHLGRTVARTDDAGHATFALDVSPGEDVEVSLDTTDAKKLLPRSPTLTFKAPDRDEPVVVEQRFTLEAPPKRRIVVARPVGPRRLGDG